jgi:hypothetical protein
VSDKLPIVHTWSLGCTNRLKGWVE